jgi:hypothetical protein
MYVNESEVTYILLCLSYSMYLDIYYVCLNFAPRHILCFISFSRDLEMNNITDIHEDTFLPLNSIKDL